MIGLRHIVLLIAAFVALAPGARAQSRDQPAVLVVTKSESARDCPDAIALAERVSEMSGDTALTAEQSADYWLAFRVHIDANKAGYAATVRAEGARTGVRRIADIGSNCTGLVEALAVTLAIILDDERATPAAPPNGRLPLSPSDSAFPPEQRSVLGGRIHAGLGVTLGVLESAALAVVGGAAIDGGWGMLILDVLWLPPRAFALEPGDVEVTLLAATLSGCWRALGTPNATWLAPCAQVGFGLLEGDGGGYTRDRHAERPWVALGGGVRAGGVLAGPLDWVADARLFAPVHRESFVVDNVGTAHETPPLGALIAGGVALTIW